VGLTGSYNKSLYKRLAGDQKAAAMYLTVVADEMVDAADFTLALRDVAIAYRLLDCPIDDEWEEPTDD
jgi:hypothetical protein